MWSKWFVFFADERIVPIHHADSNYAACKDLLSKVPPEQVFKLPLVDEEKDLTNPSLLSIRYEDSLRKNCEIDELNQMPILDLCLLGMGPDGHTASLFPGHRLSATSGGGGGGGGGQESFNGKCVAYLTDSPKPPPERITLTLETIKATRHIIFVATGESKADVVSQCFKLTPTSDGAKKSLLLPDPSSGYPCSFVKPRSLNSSARGGGDITPRSDHRSTQSCGKVPSGDDDVVEVEEGGEDDGVTLVNSAPLTWYLDHAACSKVSEDVIERSTNFHDVNLLSFPTLVDLSASPASISSGGMSSGGGDGSEKVLIPFFVYGTLMRGFGNHKVIKPYMVSAQEAITSNARLVHYSSAGFPGMLKGTSTQQKVKGELIYVRPEHYERAVQDLDRLEGCYGDNDPENVYDKRIVDVTIMNKNSNSGGGNEEGVEEVVKAYSYWIAVSDAETCWGAVPVTDEDPVTQPGVASWSAYIKKMQFESAKEDWLEKAKGSED
jgi:6-phosphogluconolactonase